MKARATRYMTNTKEISELLESDDELPDSYDEVPNIPAYQNDRRFECHESKDFQWLHQQLEDTSARAQFMKHQSSQREEPCLKKFIPKETTEVKKNKKKVLISKGVLSKRDIFFIKSIEEYSTDTTLLWFIDFLIHKAIKPLQRSCLVADITANHYMAAKEPLSDFNKRYYLKLVVN